MVAGADGEFAASTDGSFVRSIWNDDCMALGVDVDLAVWVEVESVRSNWFDDSGVAPTDVGAVGSGDGTFEGSIGDDGTGTGVVTGADMDSVVAVEDSSAEDCSSVDAIVDGGVFGVVAPTSSVAFANSSLVNFRCVVISVLFLTFFPLSSNCTVLTKGNGKILFTSSTAEFLPD